MTGWEVLGLIMLCAPLAIMIVTVHLEDGWHGVLVLSLILLAAALGTAWIILSVHFIFRMLP